MTEIEEVELLADPDTIFHYTTTKVAIENILSNKQLRLSPLSKTNDPKDYNSWLFGSSLWGERQDLENNLRSMLPYIKKLTHTELRFISFCRNRENISDNLNWYFNRRFGFMGCFRPRMWSQYGEGHFGVCLAFSLKAIEEEFEKNYSRNKDFFSRHIEYRDFPIISQKSLIMNGNRLATLGKEKYADEFINENWEELFFLKHKDYKDEVEHRIIQKADEPHEEFLYFGISNCIRAIVLGERFNEVYKPLIESYTNNLGIFVRKLHWHNGGFILGK